MYDGADDTSAALKDTFEYNQRDDTEKIVAALWFVVQPENPVHEGVALPTTMIIA